jgi:hypothetical protein
MVCPNLDIAALEGNRACWTSDGGFYRRYSRSSTLESEGFIQAAFALMVGM